MRRTTAAAVAVTLVAGGTAGALGAPTGLAAAAVSSRAALGDCSGAITGPSYPDDLTDADGTLFFTAYDNHQSPTMWSTDGTRAGTVWLNDLSGEERRYGSKYSELEPLGSTMFFTADGFDADGALSGTDLWRSDGTKAGTVVVKHYLGFGDMTALGDTLYFFARDPKRGVALRRTDGTRAGTSLVKDLHVAADAWRGPGQLTAVGDTLYFTFDDGAHGQELWRSDGTEEGTVLVKDIAPGEASSSPETLTAVGDHLFFWADDRVHGRELWTSDGTDAGTVLVGDIGPGDLGSDTYSQVASDGALYFSAVPRDGEIVDLWRSDGTPEGTVVVRELGERPYYVDAYYPQQYFDLAAVGGRVFFAATDPDDGEELWSTDGTEAGTAEVKDLQPGVQGSVPDRFTTLGNEVYFTAFSEEGSLWRSDGTAAGTIPVLPAGAGPTWNLTASGDQLFFAHDDGVHDEEVWVSDGTESGTHLVRDIYRRVDWDISGQQVDPRNTAVSVKGSFDSPGRFSAAPALKGGIRPLEQEITGTGTIEVTLTLHLTRAAKRKLRRNGHVKIGAEFTFASCTGQVTGYETSYYLRKQ